MARPRYAIARAGGTGHEQALIGGPASCDQGDPEAAKQWAAVLRLAERTWQEATRAPLSLAAATDAE